MTRQKFGAMADEFLKLYPATSDDEAALASNDAIRDNSRVSTYLWSTKWTRSVREPVYTYFWTHRPPGPDHDIRGEAAQQPSRLDDAEPHLSDAIHQIQGPTAKPSGPHLTDGDPGDLLGKGVGAAVGREMHPTALAHEFARQGLGREQMAAGAAGRQHKIEFRTGGHTSLPPSRRRVSASIIPMPSASASIDEPP